MKNEDKYLVYDYRTEPTECSTLEDAEKTVKLLVEDYLKDDVIPEIAVYKQIKKLVITGSLVDVF